MKTDKIAKIAAAALIIIFLGIAGAKWLNNTPATQGNAVLEFLDSPQAAMQEVTITAEGLHYLPDPITLTVGKPVKLQLDRSIIGCMRYLVGPQLGLQMSTHNGEDIVYAIPRKPGTYPFSCSMNMGKGTIIIEDA